MTTPVDSIIRFAASDGTSVERAGTNYPITTTSLNVGFGTSGIAEIDIANPTCQFGNCPVILKGFNFDKLLPSGDSTIADAFCWFGDGLPCSSVPINIRLDELSCASPTLPADPTIVPFGVLVLGADTTPPGTLYVPEGLEMTFFEHGASANHPQARAARERYGRRADAHTRRRRQLWPWPPGRAAADPVPLEG